MQYIRFITLNHRKVGKWMLCTHDERVAYEEAFKTAGIAYRLEIRG